jgi:hypothetical protein
VDLLLARLDELGIELSPRQFRLVVAVGVRGCVTTSSLCQQLAMPKQTMSDSLKQLTVTWSRKHERLTVPEVPLVVRTRRPGQVPRLRLSRTGLQLFSECGLLEPSNDPA